MKPITPQSTKEINKLKSLLTDDILRFCKKYPKAKTNKAVLCGFVETAMQIGYNIGYKKASSLKN